MKHYKSLLNLFSAHLESYRSGLAGKQPAELYGPENYILSLGGKRVRPLLALIACDLFDADPKLALDSALCVELFHNFSLMHDDILDAAPLRRNQPTVHTKWSVNTAILSGDAMLVKSMSALESYPAEEFKQLSQLFLKTAVEVCEGQQYDMDYEKNETVHVDEYIRMITFKTAVLLGCSLQMGAINAKQNPETQANIYGFGKHLGIAFQLLDDLLDAYSDHPEFGKQVGGDIIANKKTFLLLNAMELSDEKQRQQLQELLTLGENKAQDKIKGVKQIFDALEIPGLCKTEADQHTQVALTYLHKIPANAAKKKALEEFALQLLNRNT